MTRFVKITGLFLLTASLSLGTLAIAAAQDSMKKTDTMQGDTTKNDSMHSDSMHSDSMHSDSMNSDSTDKMKHDDKMAPTGK